MVEAGLSPEQALRCATANAAALLGLDDRGLVREGRRADLVVLDADPLADIRNTRRIRAVWQRGREMAGPAA
jgi:imidazolonepropionase-like amidohydrolase